VFKAVFRAVEASALEQVCRKGWEILPADTVSLHMESLSKERKCGRCSLI
jgi:hypothetical protein